MISCHLDASIIWMYCGEQSAGMWFFPAERL